MYFIFLMMYPIIKGDQILFSEDVSRPVQPLELEGVTHEEYKWLVSQKPGNNGRSLGYFGHAFQPKASGSVVVLINGEPVLNPINTLAVKFYDDVVAELGEVERLLEQHRKNNSEE